MLLVTSRQDAKAYLIAGHEAVELFKFHYDTPEYTDKEGRFDRGGNGRRYGGGASDIEISSVAYTEFLEELNTQLDLTDTSNVEDVILFASEHLHQKTKDNLPTFIKSKIVKTNVTHESVNELAARAHKE